VLKGISTQDVDLRVQVATDKPSAGAPHEVYLLARNRSGAGHYRLRVALIPGGAVTFIAQKWVAGSQSPTNLGPALTVAGLAHQAGTFIWLRAQVTGINPTGLRIKAWAAGQAEASGWLYAVTDSESVLQLPGSVGILSRLPAASTSAPLMFSYDNYAVSIP
jgi:hypothetical protein